MKRHIIIKRQEINQNDWDSFVYNNKDGWLVHTYSFLEALALWPQNIDASYAAINKNGEISAIFPLILNNENRYIFNKRSMVTPSSVLWDNNLITPNELKELLNEIRALEKINVLALTLYPLRENNLQGNETQNPLTKHLGLQNYPERNSWIIDLRGDSNPRDKYSKLAKREIKFVEKQDIKLITAKTVEHLDIYYTLHLETCARTDISPHPHAYFEKIFTNFIPKGFSRIMLLEYKGKVVAAQNTSLYKRYASYWTGASLRDLKGANRYLFDKQIQQCKTDNFLFYETGEAFLSDNATNKEKGLSTFKQSFGAEFYPFWQITDEKYPLIINLIRKGKKKLYDSNIL